MARSLVWTTSLFVLIHWACANGGVESREAVLRVGQVLVAAEEEGAMAGQGDAMQKERGEPPDNVSLSLNGVRYEAIHWGKAQGLKQNGGYIIALDEKTGSQKWLVRVYAVRYQPDKEEDKQDVFIRRITKAKNKQSLLIENERDENYILDLRNLTVKGPFLPPR